MADLVSSGRRCRFGAIAAERGTPAARTPADASEELLGRPQQIGRTASVPLDPRGRAFRDEVVSVHGSPWADARCVGES